MESNEFELETIEYQTRSKANYFLPSVSCRTTYMMNSQKQFLL